MVKQIGIFSTMHFWLQQEQDEEHILSYPPLVEYLFSITIAIYHISFDCLVLLKSSYMVRSPTYLPTYFSFKKKFIPKDC